MARELRTIDCPEIEYDPDQEHAAVITVRLPHASHVELMRVARKADVSLNSLAVAKLVAGVKSCPVWRTRTQKDKAQRLREEIRREVESELRAEQARQMAQAPGILQQVDDSLDAIRRDALRTGGPAALAQVDHEIAVRQPQEATP